MKFFGWDHGRKRDHPPALKQNRHEKTSAGACTFSNRPGSRSDWPPDFGTGTSGDPIFSSFAKCAERSFSKVLHASYSSHTAMHAKRCESSTVLVLEPPDQDAAEWDGSLQESIRVVFSHEQKGLLAIGTFAFNEMGTAPQNPPANEQALLSNTDDTNVEMYDWLHDKTMLAEPDDIMWTPGQVLHSPETVEDTDTEAAEEKTHEGAIMATRCQGPWAEKQAADSKHQKAEKNELSKTITRPDVGLSLFHGLKTQVFPLPSNCWETPTELPIYARASKHRDFAAYTGLACGLFSADSFRKFRRMWLRGTTSLFEQQKHNLQQPALCYKPRVTCNGQEMVSSAPAKDKFKRLANQTHARRNMGIGKGKGKGCARYNRSQHCECNGCKEQLDLCAYANQKLRSGCTALEIEHGHWITTDSEYLILEM